MGTSGGSTHASGASAAGPSIVIAGYATAAYTPDNTLTVNSAVISRRPNEKLGILTKQGYLILCDGERSDAKSMRDLFIGFAVSALIGLIGLMATANWNDVFTKAEWGAAVWAAIMFAIVVAAGVGAWINDRSYSRLLKGSAYSNLMADLKSQFEPEAK